MPRAGSSPPGTLVIRDTTSRSPATPGQASSGTRPSFFPDNPQPRTPKPGGLYRVSAQSPETSSDYNSQYHALQLSVERRFAHGISLLANYTWSKQRDNFGNGGTTTDPFNRNFDWGISDLDRAHLFNFSAVWQIPGRIRGPAGAVLNGWELTALTNWQSGAPFTILSGVDNSLSGVGRDRANFTGTDLAQARLSGLSHGQEIQRFFDTSLFVPNPIGSFGNSGKNILRGPRSFNTDIGVIKNIHITERLRSQLRGEFFNAFNNVNFGQPGATVGSPSLGRITGAGSPRIVQLALKVAF